MQTANSAGSPIEVHFTRDCQLQRQQNECGTSTDTSLYFLLAIILINLNQATEASLDAQAFAGVKATKESSQMD